jgi:hypothetical protein
MNIIGLWVFRVVALIGLIYSLLIQNEQAATACGIVLFVSFAVEIF